MNLSTESEVRAAVKREYDTIRDEGDSLPDDEIENIVNVVLQIPAEDRETQLVGFVRDAVERRRGDPRHDR